MITLQLDLHDVYLLCALIDRARGDVEYRKRQALEEASE